MDAIELLTADHNRVRGLFARFQSAEESENTEEMRLLAAKICEELTVHTTIEEEIFYPKVKPGSEELTDVVAEGVEEHNVAKRLITEIQGGEPGSEEWVAKVKVLIESVEHHAEEEESEMFPEVRSNFSSEDRESLATQLTARKKELGAPTIDETIDLTKEQLLTLAQEQEIPGRSTMSRDELAATVDPRG